MSVHFQSVLDLSIKTGSFWDFSTKKNDLSISKNKNVQLVAFNFTASPFSKPLITINCRISFSWLHDFTTICCCRCRFHVTRDNNFSFQKKQRIKCWKRKIYVCVNGWKIYCKNLHMSCGEGRGEKWHRKRPLVLPHSCIINLIWHCQVVTQLAIRLLNMKKSFTVELGNGCPRFGDFSESFEHVIEGNFPAFPMKTKRQIKVLKATLSLQDQFEITNVDWKNRWKLWKIVENWGKFWNFFFFCLNFLSSPKTKETTFYDGKWIDEKMFI